ncbi:hypothetical protein BOX15_Mlig030272g3, partial [Macrostomum lignano]
APSPVCGQTDMHNKHSLADAKLQCPRVFASLLHRPLGPLPSALSMSDSLSARPFPTEFLSHLELAWSDTLEVAGDVSLRVPPMQADFCKRPDRPSLLAVGDEEGGVLLMDTELPAGSGLLTAWRAHRNAIFDVQWLADSADQLLTASGDKTVRLHSCLDRREIRAFNGHTSSVKSLSCRPGEPASGGQFCSSSRDGTVRLWDSRTPGGSVGVIPDAHAGGPVISSGSSAASRRAASSSTAARRRRSHATVGASSGGGGGASSVTCAVFIDSNSLATCGAADGVIKLWDIRALSASGSGALTPRRRRSSVSAPKPLTPRQILAYPGPGKPHGYSHLAFDRGRLFASCLDSAVYEFRPLMLRPEPSAVYRGQHRVDAFYSRVSVSPDGRFLAAGSNDCRVALYTTDWQQAGQPPALLSGFDAEVPVAVWCPGNCDPLRLATLSDDCTVRLWRLRRRRHWEMEGPAAEAERVRLRALASLADSGSGDGCWSCRWPTAVSSSSNPTFQTKLSASSTGQQRQMNIRKFLSATLAAPSAAFSRPNPHQSPQRRQLTLLQQSALTPPSTPPPPLSMLRDSTNTPNRRLSKRPAVKSPSPTAAHSPLRPLQLVNQQQPQSAKRRRVSRQSKLFSGGTPDRVRGVGDSAAASPSAQLITNYFKPLLPPAL